MRIKRFFSCVVLLLLFCGCAPQTGDYFAPFQGAYAAQIEGTWQGMAFAARLAAPAPDADGAREMTLTFYAPQSLSGTVLTRGKAGALTIDAHGLSLPLGADAAKGYGALFSLFPTAAEVESVTRENGQIRLDGAGFSLLFASDGTPLAAENGSASVRILDWRENF